jgi:hypothetical protein
MFRNYCVAILEQIHKFHLDTSVPVQGGLWGDHARSIFEYAMAKRQELESFSVIDVRDSEAKARLLGEADRAMEVVRMLCNLLIAGAVNTVDGSSQRRGKILPNGFDQYRDRIFDKLMEANSRIEIESALDAVRELILDGSVLLNAGNPNHKNPRRPFHWPVEFPEVFARGGLDAFVGNPPFMGGSKITAALGTDYREHLMRFLTEGATGKIDLCGFFFLRGVSCIRGDGCLGLIATNSLSQGDSAKIGLKRILNSGRCFFRALSDTPWPGLAGVTVSVIWVFNGEWQGEVSLDEEVVEAINEYLRPEESQSQPLTRLQSNVGKAFRGTEIKGIGFTLSFSEAEALLAADPRNKDIIFPYINGDDLYSRPDQSPSRMIINFHEWTYEQASKYPECLKIVTERVKPFRDTITKQIHEPNYWKFWDKRLDSYALIKAMPRVLARSQVGNRHSVAFLPTGIVYDTTLIVFALSEFANFGLLQSSIHEEWARVFSGAALRTDMRYSTKGAFDTFPFCATTHTLEMASKVYYEFRRDVMQSRQEGLTKTYNRFHDRGEASADIARLRALHVEMDQSVADAYGWTGLHLSHDFHETKQGIRFTVSESARREILDRLLELNHQRYAEEVLQGLHDKGSKSKGTRKKAKAEQEELF